MSGELGAYTTVHGNQGDRNDLDLWWKGGSLVRLLVYERSCQELRIKGFLG